jgi:hypothetical protein
MSEINVKNIFIKKLINFNAMAKIETCSINSHLPRPYPCSTFLEPENETPYFLFHSILFFFLPHSAKVHTHPMPFESIVF